MIPIDADVLRKWAQERRRSANAEYSHDGRGGYGDIAGMVEILDEVIDICNDPSIVSDPEPNP